MKRSFRKDVLHYKESNRFNDTARVLDMGDDGIAITFIDKKDLKLTNDELVQITVAIKERYK